jgi:hypothetical protein
MTDLFAIAKAIATRYEEERKARQLAHERVLQEEFEDMLRLEGDIERADDMAAARTFREYHPKRPR